MGNRHPESVNPPAALLGSALRERRQAAGLTQAELGKKLGVCVETVRSLETGRHKPQPSTVWLLEAALREGLPHRPDAAELGLCGDALREHRRAASLTQRALAKQLGVKRRTVSRWERQSHLPMPAALESLRKAFRV